MAEENKNEGKEDGYQEPTRKSQKVSDESFASKYGIYVAGAVILGGVTFGMVRTFSDGEQPRVSAPIILPPASTPAAQPVVPPVNEPSQQVAPNADIQVPEDSAAIKTGAAMPAGQPTVPPVSEPSQVASSVTSTPAKAAPLAQAPSAEEGEIERIKARLDILEKRLAGHHELTDNKKEKPPRQKEAAHSKSEQLDSQAKKIESPQKTASPTPTKKVEPPVKAASKPASAEMMSKKYRIHAIVAGRAWLAGQDGALVTVSVGDLAPGEGAVTKIDPDNGVVFVGDIVIK